MADTLERKFKKRFEGVLQFVSDYEDFGKVPIGASMSILGNNGDIAGYLEDVEKIDKNKQKVFIQYKKNGKYFVKEHGIPLTGKINLNRLKAGKRYKIE